jgi:hypothetical protein
MLSPTSEWMNLSQTDSVEISNGRSFVGPEGKSSKRYQAVGRSALSA